MNFRKNNKGLTLIETVISLTLVAVLATAFAGAMVVGLQSESTSDNLDYSTNFSSSIFAFLLDNNNYQDIIKTFKAEGLIQNENNAIYQNNLISEENSFYNDLEGISNLDEKYKEIINSFDNISGYNLLDEISEIKIDKIITSPDTGEELILYRVELNIISDSAEGRQSYSVATILGDLNE